jgi:hypothetical protein
MSAYQKRVSLARDGEEALKAAFRRMAEVSRLKAMLPAVVVPDAIAGKPLATNDRRIFELAVFAANGADPAGQFQQAAAAAACKANARFFDVVAAAMRQAKAARSDVLTVTKAHVIAALAAKLELEQSLGRLPNTMEHSTRAAKVAMAWFRNQDFATYPAGHKAWSKIRKAAGFDYLPPAVRGKGK